ncbi:trehalose-phosphatase [Escherichia coli]
MILACNCIQSSLSIPARSWRRKGLAFALHYRQAPQHEDALMTLAQRITQNLATNGVTAGKVCCRSNREVPVKVRQLSLCRKLPLSGNAVFLGDDLTDESGFAVVNRLGGMSVKIGTGATQASWRLAGAGCLELA